jgi:hypothetical protein
LAWKRTLAAYERTHVGPAHILNTLAFSPGVVLEIIEDLVHERRLRRDVAVHIEKRILDQVVNREQWCGFPPIPLPPLREEGVMELAREINHYWR